jgi:glycosyltransferase involved in cell wall biosynthesis
MNMIAASQSAPLVSIVLPTYQRPHLLDRAIATVQNQTFLDWELLVVDDNGVGTEWQRRTEDLVRKAMQDARVHYLVHEFNRGACAARNTGTGSARGRYVAYLDDDDAWYPFKLERQVAKLESVDAAVALVYGSLRRVDETGRTRVQRADGTAHLWRNLLLRNGIGTTSVVVCRREALEAVGGFDERLPSMQDYDLYIRLAQRYPFAWVEEVLLDKHSHAGATLGKDLQGVLRANEVFYQKHRALFEADRGVHYQRLVWYGRHALRAGSIGLGRTLLMRAWRLSPGDVRTLAQGLLASRPSIAAYRAVRNWSTAIRTRIREAARRE